MNKNKKDFSIDQDVKRPIRSEKAGDSRQDNSLVFGDSDLKSICAETRAPKRYTRNGKTAERKLPKKQTFESKKSREVSPDSDDLSSFSGSDSSNSGEKSSNDGEETDEQTYEKTKIQQSETSSYDSEIEKDPSEGSESENSAESSSEEGDQGFDEVLSIRESQFIIPANEEEKRISNFSSEFDEISGTIRPPSKRFMGPASSAINEPSADNEVGRESMAKHMRHSDRAVLASRPISKDEKITWTRDDDTKLRMVVEKQKKKNRGVVNWSKVANDLEKSRSHTRYQISKDDCKKRYHQITKQKANKNWTFKEIEDLIYYHKKYKNNWKRIARKIPSKNDKQCKYKYEQL